MELVYEIVLEQDRHQLAAAVDMMSLPGWVLSERTASTGLSRMMVVSRQIGCFRVRDTTYFLGAFIRSPNGIARLHGLEGFGVDHIGAPAEEKGIDGLHRLEEGDADVVVPVGDGPAAVGKASVAILVLASGA